MHAIPRSRRLLGVLAVALVATVATVAVSVPATAAAPAPRKQAAHYEVHFMTRMIHHHHMAVMMSEMCLRQATHPELKAMCQQVITAQQQEITTMRAWLAAWYAVSPGEDMMTGHMRSMHRFEHWTGAKFEIQFMSSMIRHHWKAVSEARKCVARAYHSELVSMCQEMITMQLAEIQQMRSWLHQWYSRPGGRPVTAN